MSDPHPIDVLRSRCVALGAEALYDLLADPPTVAPLASDDAGRYRQCFVLAPALRELLAALVVAALLGAFWLLTRPSSERMR